MKKQQTLMPYRLRLAYLAVCRVLEVNDSHELFKDQRREFVYARMFTMYHFRNEYKMATLGSFFGKDHATVRHHIGTYNDLLFQKDASFMAAKKKVDKALARLAKVIIIENMTINKHLFKI